MYLHPPPPALLHAFSQRQNCLELFQWDWMGLSSFCESAGPLSMYPRPPHHLLIKSTTFLKAINVLSILKLEGVI